MRPMVAVAPLIQPHPLAEPKTLDPLLAAGYELRVQTFRLNDVAVGKPLAPQGNTVTVKVSRDSRPVDPGQRA